MVMLRPARQLLAVVCLLVCKPKTLRLQHSVVDEHNVGLYGCYWLPSNSLNIMYLYFTIMSDDKRSIMANHHDFTMSVKL